MPDWRRVPLGHGAGGGTRGGARALPGEAGQIPAYYQSAELLSLLDLPDAHRLLPGSSPAWQTLLLEHFALQTLLDAEPEASWPLASLVTPAPLHWRRGSRRWPPSGSGSADR